MELSQAQPALRARTQADMQRNVILVILLLIIGITAAIPRAAGLADFLTTDEAYHWIRRTERFQLAVGEGLWIDTIQSGHPGVTLMWVGSLGLQIESFAANQDWTQIASRLEHLAWMRLPVTLLHALCVLAGYGLMRRLVRSETALVAALLWATSPYLIAHGRLLHLDGLLTDFVTLSLLLLLGAVHADRDARSLGRWSLLGAGICAGLALLTKGPALIALPVAGLLLFWQIDAPSLARRFGRSIGWYTLWLASALAVVWLLWPALWVDPAQALGRYFGEILDNGGRPNGDGQFFLGAAVGDPGALFYIVADLFRLAPLELIGLLAFPLALWRRDAEQHPAERQALLGLLAFAAFWTLVMTLGPKKFDRYVLPTWPALMLLAAAGLTAMFDRFNRLAPVSIARRATPLLGLALVLAAQASILAWYHPYYLSYYNPLLGGGPAAQRTVLIGWGEGMDQVGAYLRTRPDIDYGPTLAALPPTLQPFIPVPVKDVFTLGQAPANYAVVYLESIQRGAYPEIYSEIQQTQPLHRVEIHGIEYARIHQLPRPFAMPVGAQFGAALHLRGVTIKQEAGRLVVIPSWDVQAAPAADYLMFVHLLDAQGQRVAQIDAPPGGAELPPTGAWEAGQQIAVPLPVALPTSLPSGEYRLAVGLYDSATGARLPLIVGVGADPALAGPDALLLDSITLP